MPLAYIQSENLNLSLVIKNIEKIKNKDKIKSKLINQTQHNSQNKNSYKSILCTIQIHLLLTINYLSFYKQPAML